MSRRVSLAVMLCEDSTHRDFARHLCKRLGIPSPKLRVVPLPGGKGSGEQHVRERFADEVRECRARQPRAATALIVIVDADMETVARREAVFASELESHDLDVVQGGEPIMLWIPKRNIETWIKCLLCDSVDEQTDYSKERASAGDVRAAAGIMFDWSRPGADPGKAPVPSLQHGLGQVQRMEH